LLRYGKTDLPFDLGILAFFAVGSVVLAIRSVWGLRRETTRTRQTKAAIHYTWVFAVLGGLVAIGTFHLL
jgi:hypothetical protein